MPPPLPVRDPRRDPRVKDRLLLGTEGTERVIVDLTGGVVWRFLGGTQKRTDSIERWRADMETAQIRFRGP